jgi:cell division protein FtsB
MDLMNSFDQLAQEIFRQKQTMDTLRSENEELHRQIAEIKDGRGVFVMIGDKRYSLRSLRDQYGR